MSIKFMRDKKGNLYSVKDGKVTGRIMAVGDSKLDSKKTDKTRKK